MLTIVSIHLYSQEKFNNFIIENNKVRWEKIYDSSFTREELIITIKNSGLIYDLDTSEDVITGKFSDVFPEYKMAGYSDKTTPFYLRKNYLDGFILIEHKVGKVRVTIINIALLHKGNFTNLKGNERKYLDDYAIQKSSNILTNFKFTNAFKRAASVIIEKTFDMKFNFKNDKVRETW